MRAKRIHQAVKDSDTNTSLKSCIVCTSIGICSFNTNQLENVTFLCSELVLPLLLVCTVVRIKVSTIKTL